MCRLFAFRSMIRSKVHTSLVGAENALMAQSQEHPDGWGIAYYLERAPHVVKAATTALTDSFFRRVSGIVSSETVIAHIRKGTLGDCSVVNTHPFQFGPWTFVHNGNIRNFHLFQDTLKNRVDESLRPYIMGMTDSEMIFYLILSKLRRQHSLGEMISFTSLRQATEKALEEVIGIVGPYCAVDSSPEMTYLSFVITNGKTMLIHQGGKDLYYSTYKTKCSERQICPFFSDECEAPSSKGIIKHLVISSEKIKNENYWIKMKPGEIVGVDPKMIFQTAKL